MANNKKAQPAWFNTKDARYKLEGNFRSWYAALSIRNDFRVLLDQGNEIDWDNYLEATAIEAIKQFDSEIKSKPIEEISSSSLRKNFNSLIKWEMRASGKRLLLVDLDCSDVRVCQQFKDWLSKAREQNSLPISRRGDPSLNIELNESHIASWGQYKILQVYDLDFWAKVKQQRKVSHPNLIHIVAPEYKRADSKDWGREARAKLDEALASMVLLAEKGGVK